MNLLFAASTATLISLGAAIAPPAPQPVAPAAGAPPSVIAPKAERKKIYDENADVKAQIAAAVAKAKRDNSRVLVQWGGNWCGWCTLLHETMSTNPDIAKLVQYEYVVVHADAGQPAGKNLDLATSYGADLQKHGFPYLTILDGDGKVIANQDTGSLEIKGEMKHDAGLVLGFLKKHVATPQDAQALVDAGRREAKSSGRTVFLHFGAPWCAWCHRLDDWMDSADTAPLLQKDFVNLKIDVDRTTGGKEVMDNYRKDPKGGIPWFAFISADGKVLTTSEGPDGNVGFPASAQEILHFEAMLAKAARNLSKEEQVRIVESLRKQSKPAAAGHR